MRKTKATRLLSMVLAAMVATTNVPVAAVANETLEAGDGHDESWNDTVVQESEAEETDDDGAIIAEEDGDVPGMPESAETGDMESEEPDYNPENSDEPDEMEEMEEDAGDSLGATAKEDDSFDTGDINSGDTAPDGTSVEDPTRLNILEYQNTEPGSGMPYMGVRLKRKKDYGMDEYAWIDRLPEDSLTAYEPILRDYFPDMDITIDVPLWISVINEEGITVTQNEQTDISFYTEDTADLSGDELIHIDDDGSIEILDYKINADGEVPCISFEADSLNVFLFAGLTEREDPEESEESEESEEEPEEIEEVPAELQDMDEENPIDGFEEGLEEDFSGMGDADSDDYEPEQEEATEETVEEEDFLDDGVEQEEHEEEYTEAYAEDYTSDSDKIGDEEAGEYVKETEESEAEEPEEALEEDEGKSETVDFETEPGSVLEMPEDIDVETPQTDDGTDSMESAIDEILADADADESAAEDDAEIMSSQEEDWGIVMHRVIFHCEEGVTAYVGNENVSNSEIEAEEGEFNFTVMAEEGMAVESVLVNGVNHLKALSGTDGEYRIESIQSDTTVIDITACEAVETDDEEQEDREDGNDGNDTDSYEKIYTFEDSRVSITATVTDRYMFPENTKFVCTAIDEKSDEFMAIRAQMAEFYHTTEDDVDVLPYDISFISDGEEVEPAAGSVSVKWEFKKPIHVAENEDASLVHILEDPEVLAESIASGGQVKTIEVEMEHFSPVVVTKTNVLGAPVLKSVQKTDESGNTYYISKTSNINEDGAAAKAYSNNMNVTDTVSADGALYVEVTVQYGGEGIGCDWLYIKDSSGNILYRDADGKTVGSTNGNNAGKIGGGGVNFDQSNRDKLTPSGTVTYRFETDELQFTWRTDGSVTGYGYYAVITPTYATDPIPDYHFEELEDGTYALVFDKGGDINAFVNRPEVKEAIAPYKNLISEIRLHKETTSLQNGAFKGLPALTKVTMPRNSQLTEIGKNVFANCENLESIDIPASVTSMGPAFGGCSSLTTVNFASGSTLTTLPNGLFKDLAALRNVTLPQGLTSVPESCFYNCTSLQNIDLPETVTSVGANAFRNTGLHEVPGIDHLTSIGNYAFAFCPNIKEVHIPATVTTLGPAFEGCSGITDFIFEDGTSFPRLGGWFFQGMQKLTNVKLPSDLTTIGERMFYNCTSLEHVDYPDTVTSIGKEAFLNCSKLQDFEIPSGVKSLGISAFKNCTSLKDMAIPNTVTSIGTGLFSGCSNLFRCVFENGSRITSLPSEMFQNCNKLEMVKLPDRVTAIPSSYFYGCTSLAQVELPENLTSIGGSAFYNCYNLENMTFPNTLKTIGSSAFYNCDKLANVVIPKSVTSIGNNAWQDCSNLRSVVFEEGSPLTSLQTAMFYNCPKLEELVLPTRLTAIPDSLCYGCVKLSDVEIPANVTTIGASSFRGCSSLTHIDLPAKLTQIYSYAFRDTGLTDITIPNKVTSIGSYAFYNTKIHEVTIPKSVSSISSYAFASNPNLESVVFEPGTGNVNVNTYAFYGNPMLGEIELREGITNLQSYSLGNNRRLEELTIPSTVTSIGASLLYNDTGLKKLTFPASATNADLKITSSGGYTFGKLASLEELYIDRNISSNYSTTSDCYQMNPDVKVTIGKHVDRLDNMFVSVFNEQSEIVFEGENDFTVTTRIANTSEDVKWRTLAGDFYVDPQGVVYKLNNSDNTASLFHVPAGITEYTVPETITSVAGKTYNVTMVHSYAVREADDLTALTFEKPEQVTIPQFAFTGCPTLATVNGQPELFKEDWESVSLLCDFPVHMDEQPEQVLLLLDQTELGEAAPGEEAPRFSFGVSITGQERMADDNLTYVYPTGASARLDFAISNESNLDMSDRVIRVYFAFDGDNYTMGNYNPGQTYTLVNTATGARYPMKVGRTDATGVYYYDITGFKPGDTLAFNNQFSYQSPTSGGGTMRVWAESISAAEAAEMEGKVSEPGKYMLAEWYTVPTPYNVTKAVNGSPTFQFTASQADLNDDNIYVRNLAYQIRMTSSGGSGTNNAKDYVKYVDFYDDMVLPEGMQWNTKVIEAVRNKAYSFNTENGYLRVKIDGVWTEICRLSVPTFDYLRSASVEVVTDDNGNDALRILWSYRNQYWNDVKSAPTADLPANTFTIYPSTLAIQVKRDSDLWNMLREGEEFTPEESDAMRRVNNKVTETTHYSYSEPQTKEALAASRLVYTTTGFSMTKTKATSGNGYFSMPHDFNISVTNSGLTHKKDIDLITDTMQKEFYISPEGMEEMFCNQNWGPFLKIDVTSARLAHRPGLDVHDVYGNSLSVDNARDHAIEPIPYSGLAGPAADAVSTVTASAKLSLYWNDAYDKIVLDVKDDSGVVQESYTIGEGGDFASIEEALDAIGYVVSYYAVYTVTWDLDDKYTLYKAALDGVEASSVGDLTPEQIKGYEYTLYSGRTNTFTINATAKDTTMMLTSDAVHYYPSNYVTTSNTAYAKDRDGRQVGIANWSGRVYRELSLGKSAVANGASLSAGYRIPDDTVIDYTLSFTNSGATYDMLPLTDHMGGTQVLLVPVRGNRDALYYPAGESEGVPIRDSSVETFTYRGIEYYILDQAGTYKDVTIDGRIADTIRVERGQGSASTIIIWYYQNVTGSSANASSISRSISYKALADSSRLGAATVDENGSTITNHALRNEAWLGGRPAHRLYASLYGESEAVQFIKRIVEDPDAAYENLIGHSLVQDGDEVQYKLIITNTGELAATISGNRLYDALPTTGGVFAWSKDNVTDISYVTEGLGSEIETTDESYWYIDSIEPGTGADTASRGLYYIRWNNDFSFTLEPKGEIWIYVTLRFPGADDTDPLTGESDHKWDNYITQNNGSVIKNAFWIDQRHSDVTHELVDFVEGYLQKGVLDTGLSGNNRFQSEDTRHFYQNGSNTESASMQEVVYYTVIYNSGNVRLYLDPLQDELPKGFRFRGLFRAIPKAATTGSGFSTSSGAMGSSSSAMSIATLESWTGNSSYVPVAAVHDENRNTITYKNANISASVTEDADGRQRITYTFGRQSNSDSYLRYDSTLGKYYLNPGEAIRFGYNCTVQGLKMTENVATNEIAMPVYDKYGLGVHMSDEESVSVTPATYRDIALNDGKCDMTTTEEEVYGHGHTKTAWVKNTTEWFSSNVSLQRLEPVPGVGKQVAGETYIAPTVTITPEGIYGTKYNAGSRGGTPYTGTVARTSIANWDIRVYNEGGTGSNSMEDYWIVDTVDSPYQFTGNFFYDYYSANGTRMSSSSIPVFSLGGRSEDDTTVMISTGSDNKTLTLDGTITVNGDPVSVDGGRAEVQLLRDPETKVETIRIHLADNFHRIPPNTYMSMIAHTQYTSNDAVLSKQFYNHVQLEPTIDFDPALVSQGKVLYRDDDGESIPYAIESGASVTMTAGYSSAARKQVTELDNPSNTGWSDQEKNFIELPGKYSTFRYDLYIDLPKDDPTSKLVLIDALPEPGDHSPFVDRDLRHSEFVVHLLSENLDFHVWSVKDDGAGAAHHLDYSEYTLEITTRTEFDPLDWEGQGEGWTAIDLSDGVSEGEKALLDAARSFRVVIDDPSVVADPANGLMGRDHQVHLRFNAKLLDPENASPGTRASNSFGYRYTVPIGATGMSTSLNAEPLPVQVLLPSVPYIVKDLKTPLNHYRPVETQATYSFIVYSGSAISSLNDASGMTDEEIAEILAANERDVMLSTVTVNAGQATGRTPFLDGEYKWMYNPASGQFEETTEHWIWENAHKYTILERGLEANGYVFSNIQHSPLNNYTFTQNSENNTALRVTNVWNKKGNLKISKTVNGPSFDPERKFTFTIHMQDGRYPVYGNFEYIGTGIRNGTITFDDNGNATIQLKHNQAIEIKNIPDGYTYTVTEAPDVWYEQQSTGSSGSIADQQLKTAAFINTRKDTTLSISKTVTGGFGNKTKKFRFEVYINDEGRELNGRCPYSIKEGEQTLSSGSLDFTEGIAYVEIAHGETAVITGLPLGARYEVDETTESREGYSVTSTNDSGTLTEEGALTTWKNQKDVTIPTAADLNVREWSMLLMLAFGLAALAIIRRLYKKQK